MIPVVHTSLYPEDLTEAFAKQLIDWVNHSDGDLFHVALSGGKTPERLFSLFAEKYRNETVWHKIHFWWGDERMVPPDNPESNFGIVNNLMFLKIGIRGDQIHRIIGEAEPLREAQRYDSEIQSFLKKSKGWPAFDLIMLGLGEDGHTASIFPNQMELMYSDSITSTALHPGTGQARITLTGKVLNNAKRVAFLVSGASKSLIFKDIISGTENSSNYPASHIQPDGELHWFVDAACTGKD